MHSIADRLTSAAPVAGPTGTAPAGRRCRFGIILDQLNDTDRDAVLTAMYSPAASPQHVGDEKIAVALRVDGHLVSHTSVRRHRVHACPCAPDLVPAPFREAS